MSCDASVLAGYDVVVAGGGNAALCAAIQARLDGASVLLLERTPRAWRGGNSKYTRNLRCASAEYPEEELLADLIAVTGAELDRDLAAFTIERSRELPAWLSDRGVRWQPALHGTLQLARTNRFFLGGGKALVNVEYEAAHRLGVEVRYESTVAELQLTGGRCAGVVVESADERTVVPARAVVVASGGYEANLGWLA